jgi:hypothetical protein
MCFGLFTLKNFTVGKENKGGKQMVDVLRRHRGAVIARQGFKGIKERGKLFY